MRWVSTVFAALSLLLCLAVGVFWFRGYDATDEFQLGTFGTGRGLWCVTSRRGTVELLRVGGWPRSEGPEWFSSTRDEPEPMNVTYLKGVATDWDRFGVTVASGTGAVPLQPDGMPLRHLPGNTSDAASWVNRPVWLVKVPHWQVALLFAAPPLLWLVNRARHDSTRLNRTTAGQCPECGYDLRATTADRCPECGASTAAPQPRRGARK